MVDLNKKKIISELKYVYSENNTLSIIFQNNDLLLGVAGFVSHSLIIYAIQLSNLSFVTNFQYSQLVWSTIINFLVFGVPFDYNKIVGVVGIIVFGIMFIRTEGTKKS